MHGDPVIVARALEAGATGYVLKDTSPEELVKAFEKVRSGTPYLDAISRCRSPWCRRRRARIPSRS